ncbi:3-isopropylmalate dehydratase small subunit [Alteromonas sp. NFXS44]|uniref:3-isopropylmalate dehydratase small subunit n=1 Tax=Alteromonas sp. NFXS44 TaxID=2818435 RepID=UPI0032DECE64
MQAFTTHTGTVLPFDRANVDTDAILPKQYLKSIKKFGYGDWLFDDLRYLDEGDAETDTSTRRKNPDFILNKPGCGDSSILLAQDNFGCGSSREHAVWALRDYGFRVVIAPSFADIFYNNCFKNGILPVTLPQSVVDCLLALREDSNFTMTVDLEKCEIRTGTGAIWEFKIDPSRRQNLLSGDDEISLTLRESSRIADFEATLKASEPWLFTEID